jgi:hypothetical protein
LLLGVSAIRTFARVLLGDVFVDHQRAEGEEAVVRLKRAAGVTSEE